MSTRATIKIKDGCAERWLYHHHDGYPEGVGKELCDILSDEVEWSLASVFTRLTEDEQYEPTDGVHGDEEYGYFINCGERELVGFPIDWRTGEWGQEVLRREYKDRRKENVAPFLIKEAFLCEFCRKICSAKCHEQLEKLLDGTWAPGCIEYEDNKDLLGRKHIITCLGPYCDRPCKYQQLDYMPYNENDGIKPLIETIRFLGNKVNELISEKKS